MENKVAYKDGYVYPSNQQALENYLLNKGKLENIVFEKDFGTLDFSSPILKKYINSHKKINNLILKEITIKGDINDKVSLATCTIDKCEFVDFNLADSQLTHTNFEGNTFTGCKVNHNFIYHNHFLKCNFEKCEFKNNKLENNFFKSTSFENCEILENELTGNYLLDLKIFSTCKIHNNKLSKNLITPEFFIKNSQTAKLDEETLKKENVILNVSEEKIDDISGNFYNENNNMQKQNEINNELDLKTAIKKEIIEDLPVEKEVVKKISNSEEKKIAKKTKKYAKYNKTQNKKDNNIKNTTTNTPNNNDITKEKEMEKLITKFSNQIETFGEEGKKGIIFGLADIIIIMTNTIRKLNAKKLATKQYNKEHNILTEKEKLNREILNKNEEIKNLKHLNKSVGNNEELKEKIEEELEKHKKDREQLKVKIKDRTLER